MSPHLREAINQLRTLHIQEMDNAVAAHERLRVAEIQNWDDSWRYEDDFLKAWFKAAGIFAAIKQIEQLEVILEGV